MAGILRVFVQEARWPSTFYLEDSCAPTTTALSAMPIYQEKQHQRALEDQNEGFPARVYFWTKHGSYQVSDLTRNTARPSILYHGLGAYGLAAQPIL